MKKVTFLILFFIAYCSALIAQTQTIIHTVPFSTTHQNMWGTGGFNLNINKEIFRVNPTVNWNSGNAGITNIGGYDFGMAMAVDFWLDIGSNYKIEGLTNGEVDVNYPIKVDLTMPAANSFDKGDTVVINTGYTIDTAWNLATRYPTTAKTSLDLHLGFGINVDLTYCAFGCVNIPIIPNLQLPVQTFDLFSINSTPSIVANYPCVLYSPCGGFFPPCLPNMCTSNTLPAVVDSHLGIDGTLDLPYVVTADSYDPSSHCINASGNDDYMTLKLEVFKFLKNFADKIPPPAGGIISTTFGNLSNSFSLPFGASLDYSVFTASFNMTNTDKQDFSFCPQIASHFDFPMPVHFFVTDPSNGNTTVSSGYGTKATFNLGEDVHFQYPCNYEFVNVTPTYSIADSINFSNHTYDVISFDFAMQAMSFQFSMPDIEVIPELCVPATCITICSPAPTWSCPGCWACNDFCSPEICTPALVFHAYNISFGPLFDKVIPLGALPPINYFNSSWSLQGFSPVTKPPFQLIPRDFSVDLTGSDISCKGDSTGSATVAVTNGKAPFTYKWDNLTTNTSSATTQTLSGLEANTHYVVVTNGNGCTAMDNVTLHEPATAITIPMVSVNDVKCNSGNTGQAIASAQGGTGTFTYSWMPNVSNTATADNLTAGTYKVTVTDANGCDTSKTIVVHEPLPLTSSFVTTDVACKGDANGTINLSVSGGTAPYSFNWSNGATIQSITNIAAGNYAVTITDGKACAVNNNITVSEPSAVLGITLNSLTNVLCKGGSNGAIAISAAGGSGPYSYKWFNSSDIELSSHSGAINNLSAGTYKIQVSDSKNCSIAATYTVSEPLQALTSSYSVQHVSCFAGTNGAIDLSVNGGTSGFTYSWSNGATTQDISGIPSGDYNVAVTDQNGCTFQQNISITQPLATLAATVTSTDVLCFNGSNGSAKTLTTGGTGPYTYQWSNSAVTPDLNNIPAGNYSVTITDSKGCSKTLNTTVSQPLAPLALTSNVTPVSCFGGTNGAIGTTVSGGSGAYSYQWSDSDSVVLSTTQSSLSNLIAGIYTVSVKDANGCLLSSDITVTQPASPITMNLIATPVTCFSYSNGSINSTIAGGTSPYSYSWSTGATSANIGNSVSGTYTLTVTDTKGCSQTSTSIVEQPGLLTASASGINVKCNGGNDGAVTLSVTGGSSPYIFNWSNGTNQQDLHDVVAGIYTVNVTDAKGCIASSGVVLTQPVSPVAISVTTDSVSCYHSSDGSISVSVSGGTLPYSLEWGASIYELNNSINRHSISGLGAGTYMARVTDGNGCIISNSIMVYEPEPLVLTGTTSPVSCHGGSDGGIAITTTGGTLPYSFSWSNNTTAQNQSGLSAGYYDVSVSDFNCCKLKSNHYEIKEPAEITTTLDVKQISCKDDNDGSIQVSAFGGVGEFNFSWSTSAVGPVIESLSANDYTLITTDANNCSKTETIVIYPNSKNCIEISNAFTPNGDNKNDTWLIYNIWLYPNATINIFNEWGNLVFTSKGYATPWDGRYDGNPLPSATYYYVIDLNNGESTYTGPVTIVR